jgi:thiol-disulfide isomerase/thioredoxin
MRSAARLCAPILLTCTILFAGCGGEDLHVREYQASEPYLELHAALDTCAMTGSAVTLARDFMQRYPDDVALQVLASSLRYDLTSDEQNAYYRDRAARESENPIAQYLAGRITYDPDSGMSYAQIILNEEPNNYWGHLLLGRSFSWKKNLTDQEFSQAESELRRAIALDNSLPYAVESLGYLYATHGDTSRADRVYEQLCRMEPAEFERLRLRLELKDGDSDNDLTLVNAFLDRNPRDLKALAYKADLLYNKKDLTEYRQTMRQAIDVKRDSVDAYDIACSFAAEDNSDSAFAWLARAVEWGYADVDISGDDPDLAKVREDPRWDNLMRQMAEQQRLQVTEMSKREIAEAQWQRANWATLGLKETAPDFTLRDLDNQPVRLSDLRGKVVILDFWATWCVWCHRASPLIEEFSAQMDPNRVAVYGVNVMENNVQKDALKAFQLQRGIHFPTLLGNPAVTNAYKVAGLPSIFVIAPDGKLAYRAYGYSPALGETLKAISIEYLNPGNEARPVVQQAPAS